jgi:hypothetical protein
MLGSSAIEQREQSHRIDAPRENESMTARHEATAERIDLWTRLFGSASRTKSSSIGAEPSF